MNNDLTLNPHPTHLYSLPISFLTQPLPLLPHEKKKQSNLNPRPGPLSGSGSGRLVLNLHGPIYGPVF